MLTEGKPSDQAQGLDSSGVWPDPDAGGKHYWVQVPRGQTLGQIGREISKVNAVGYTRFPELCVMANVGPLTFVPNTAWNKIEFHDQL